MLQNFAILQLFLREGKEKKATIEFPASSGYFSLCRDLILTSTAGLVQHGLTFLCSSAGKADTQILLRLGFTQ